MRTAGMMFQAGPMGLVGSLGAVSKLVLLALFICFRDLLGHHSLQVGMFSAPVNGKT